MPNLSKSAITLLQNLDLESVQQIQPQQLEYLIATLQKSHVPEKTERSFRTSKLALSKAKNQEILKLRNLGQTTVPPAVRPEYEMESKETFPAFSALKNSLD